MTLYVDRAAPFYPDYFEFLAVLKGILTHFSQRVWKRDFFNSAVFKTLASNALNAVRYLNFSEVHAVKECKGLYSSQRRRKRDALYRAACENPSFIFGFPSNFPFAEFFQAFIQLSSFEFLTLAKRACAYFSRGRGKNDLLKTALLKASDTDLL